MCRLAKFFISINQFAFAAHLTMAAQSLRPSAKLIAARIPGVFFAASTTAPISHADLLITGILVEPTSVFFLSLAIALRISSAVVAAVIS